MPPVPPARIAALAGQSRADTLCIARAWIAQRNVEDAKSLLSDCSLKDDWDAALDCARLFDPQDYPNLGRSEAEFARQKYEAILKDAPAAAMPLPAVHDEAVRWLEALKRRYP